MEEISVLSLLISVVSYITTIVTIDISRLKKLYILTLVFLALGIASMSIDCIRKSVGTTNPDTKTELTVISEPTPTPTPKTLSVVIASPKNDSTVTCSYRSVSDECFIEVSGQVSSSQFMRNNDNIYVFVKLPDGSGWRVSGGGISKSEANSGSWLNDQVSIGNDRDGNQQFKIIALVTDHPFSSGDTINTLPGHVAESQEIIITRAD